MTINKTGISLIALTSLIIVFTLFVKSFPKSSALLKSQTSMPNLSHLLMVDILYNQKFVLHLKQFPIFENYLLIHQMLNLGYLDHSPFNCKTKIIELLTTIPDKAINANKLLLFIDKNEIMAILLHLLIQIYHYHDCKRSGPTCKTMQEYINASINGHQPQFAYLQMNITVYKSIKPIS